MHQAGMSDIGRGNIAHGDRGSRAGRDGSAPGAGRFIQNQGPTRERNTAGEGVIATQNEASRPGLGEGKCSQNRAIHLEQACIDGDRPVGGEENRPRTQAEVV